MGFGYYHAIVHDRVLIWWTDNDGVKHEEWIEGAMAETLAEVIDGLEHRCQMYLKNAIEALSVRR